MTVNQIANRVCCVLGVVMMAGGCTGKPTFQTYRNEGLAQIHAGQYVAALGTLREAYHMVPENAENLCDLATCHVKIAESYFERDDQQAALRELDRAVNYYDRAIKSFPGHRRALLEKNKTLEQRGQYVKALEVARWASVQIGPSVEQQIFLAREYAERGDADQALLAYRQAVAMDPKSATAHWALGFYYVELVRQEEGIRHLQEAYRLDPSLKFVAAELQRLGAQVPEVLSDKTTAAQPQPK